MDKDCLIIFTHGIAEGPRVFARLEQLCKDEGYATEAITLPGHCGSCRDFASTDGRLWLEHLLATISDNQSKYAKIILVAHSLGCLLSILASDASDKIKGLILINAPLSVRVLPRAVATNLKIGLGFHITPDDKAWPASQAISVGEGHAWEYIGWIPRVRDLFGYIRKANNKLPEVRLPILAIHSDKDELVGPKTVALFRKLTDGSNCTVMRLPNSTHFYAPPLEREAATAAIMAMINNCN